MKSYQARYNRLASVFEGTLRLRGRKPSYYVVVLIESLSRFFREGRHIRVSGRYVPSHVAAGPLWQGGCAWLPTPEERADPALLAVCDTLEEARALAELFSLAYACPFHVFDC